MKLDTSAVIEFTPEGNAKITITISRELVEQARALHLTTWDLLLEALRVVAPGALASDSPLPPRCH